MDQPPPPPPHGSEAGGGGPGANSGSGNRNGLPPGNYDIFIIPPHSSGSGFLYLPSLQPHRNSFLAGVLCTLLAVVIYTIVLPVAREWLSTVLASGGTGVLFLMIGVAVAGWAWGKTSVEGGPGSDSGSGASGASNNFRSGSTAGAGHAPPPPQPGPQPQPQYQYPHANGAPPNPGAGFEPPPRPKPTWTRSTPAPGAGAGAKTSWEKAREETRKKEEERKRAEELRKKREEDERERVRQREKDAREREAREARERREREAREKESKEKREREAKEAKLQEEKAQARSRPSSPTKGRHQQPSAHTDAGGDDEAYSFRPYDKPKPPRHAAAHTATASSVYSESYAPSQSTRQTTPPPSQRGPYRTKDEDKIVIKGVYAFNNAFHNRPLAQLVSGVGPVTDGLILRISTEGLFIDDDVRGVPQREWDVKAWTLKLVEVRRSEKVLVHYLLTSITDGRVPRLPRPTGHHPRPGRQALRLRPQRRRGVESHQGPRQAPQGATGPRPRRQWLTHERDAGHPREPRLDTLRINPLS